MCHCHCLGLYTWSLLALPYATTSLTISILRFHCGALILPQLGGFALCPGDSPLPFALCPGDTHLPPFTHTLPPTRPFFNFYTLFPYFNFSPHFSATLHPLESTFYPRSRFYTLFYPWELLFFTTPFFTLLQRGRHLFTPFYTTGRQIATLRRDLITLTEALLPIYPLREALLPYSH